MSRQDALPREVLKDHREQRPVLSKHTIHHGMVWDLVRESVDFAPGVRFDREFIAHTGAVAVLALDQDGRILLIRQYRHPVRDLLWELPAGLLDIAGEDPADAAARELREETGWVADSMEHLLDWHSTPGGSTETIRLYLATDLRYDPDPEHTRQDEEAEVVTGWADLDDIVCAILAGDLRNGPLITGALALAARRARG